MSQQPTSLVSSMQQGLAEQLHTLRQAINTLYLSGDR
jgi:hypothetical protein